MTPFLNREVGFLFLVDSFSKIVTLEPTKSIWTKEERRMRINKVLPTYARLMVVGLVVFLGVLTIIGCRSTMVWVKPGATEEQFNKDKYECMRENQQVSSATYVNRYGGGSSSNVVVDPDMYNACLQARGYSLKEE